MSHTILDNANLTDANLTGAIMESVDFENVDISTAHLPKHVAKLDRELQDILGDHVKWMNSNGAEGEQANFTEVNMAGYDLRDVNLATADFPTRF